MCNSKKREGFRVLSFLMVVAMIAASLSDIGKADADEPAAGDVPALVDGVYRIETPQQLMWFSDLTNGKAKDGEGTTLPMDTAANAILVRDIDMSGYLNKDKHWQTLARKNINEDLYSGVFDGNGKKITNLYMGEGAFINNNTGTIKRLTINGIWDEDTAQNSLEHRGIMAWKNAGKIFDCKVDFNVKSIKEDPNLTYKKRFSMFTSENDKKGIIAYCVSKGEVPEGLNTLGIGAPFGAIFGCYSTVKNISKGIAGSTCSNVKNCYSRAPVTTEYERASINIRNNYRVSDEDVEPIETGNYFHSNVIQISDKNIKTVKKLDASMLCSAYVDDVDNENEGLPVLKWEKTGEYSKEDDVKEGLQVEDIKSLGIGKVVIKTNKSFTYTEFSPEDFIVKLKPEGEENEILIRNTDVQANGEEIIIEFDAISDLLDTKDKKIEVTVEPASGIGKSKVFEMKKIDFWDAYVKPAKMIKQSDKRFPEFVGYYEIKTPENLVWFVKLVNGHLDDEGKEPYAKAFLSEDLVLNDLSKYEDWDMNSVGLRFWRESIGSTEFGFKGIFDGNGHSIKGMYMLGTKNHPYISLFAKTLSAQILNLKIEKSYLGSSIKETRAGGIVSDGRDETSVDNCHFDGKIDTSADSVVAGIFTGAKDKRIEFSDVSNCSSKGDLTGGKVSGLAVDLDGDIKNSYSTAKLKGYNKFSVGQNVRAINCYSNNKADLFTAYMYGPVNSYFIEGSLRFEKYVQQAPGYDTDPIKFQKADVDELHGKLGNEFVADSFGINKGFPILKKQVPAYYAGKHAIAKLEGYIDIDDYVRNRKLVNDLISEYRDKISDSQDPEEIYEYLREAQNKLDSVQSDEDIKIEKNKKYAENQAKLKKEKEKIKRLEQELKTLVKRYNFASASFVLRKRELIYSGKFLKPGLVARSGDGKTLKVDYDYKLIYPKSKNPGSWKVKIIGIGEYSGEKSLYYKILPAKVKIRYIQSLGRGRVKIAWNKRSEADSYQIIYSLSSSFGNARRLDLSSKYSETTLKALKRNKKIFVRIRAVKTVKSSKYYGAWSEYRRLTVR